MDQTEEKKDKGMPHWLSVLFAVLGVGMIVLLVVMAFVKKDGG